MPFYRPGHHHCRGVASSADWGEEKPRLATSPWLPQPNEALQKRDARNLARLAVRPPRTRGLDEPRPSANSTPTANPTHRRTYAVRNPPAARLVAMEGIDLDLTHPARAAALASVTAIEAGDRAAWLALFAPDAVVADPVGPSPLDPSGNGHHGIEAIGAFYDTVIAQAQVRFALRESYVAGDECANVGTITSTFGDGSAGVVDGVYVYRVNTNGQIVSIRAYWEFDNLRMVPAPTVS